MIYCYLLKFSFIRNFHNERWVVFNLTSFGTLKYDCVINTREIFCFLPLEIHWASSGKSRVIFSWFYFYWNFMPASTYSDTSFTSSISGSKSSSFNKKLINYSIVQKFLLWYRLRWCWLFHNKFLFWFD